MTRTSTVGKRLVRQSAENRLSHWLIALSIFALFFSGFGQMPMYQRYGISDLPGLAWSADFAITLAVHYLAGLILVFGVIFHVVYAAMTRRYAILPRRGDVKESVEIIAAMMGRGEAPASHKYLAEQRLAYAFIGISTLALVVSGGLKVLKNLPGADIDPTVVAGATGVHNVAAILLLVGVIGHLAAFLIKENRALLPAMFGGCVDLEYARERHSLWYEELASTDADLERSTCR